MINLVLKERDDILEELAKLKNDKLAFRPRKRESTGHLIKTTNFRPKS